MSFPEERKRESKTWRGHEFNSTKLMMQSIKFVMNDTVGRRIWLFDGTREGEGGDG